MVIQGQDTRAKTVCQKDDKPLVDLEEGKAALPKSWKLTKQQQEFIDLFATSDDKNNKQ